MSQKNKNGSDDMFDNFISLLEERKLWEFVSIAQKIRIKRLEEDFEDYINNN